MFGGQRSWFAISNICFELRIHYFMLDFLYLSFLCWSNIQLSPAMLPILVANVKSRLRFVTFSLMIYGTETWWFLYSYQVTRANPSLNGPRWSHSPTPFRGFSQSLRKLLFYFWNTTPSFGSRKAHGDFSRRIPDLVAIPTWHAPQKSRDASVSATQRWIRIKSQQSDLPCPPGLLHEKDQYEILSAKISGCYKPSAKWAGMCGYIQG